MGIAVVRDEPMVSIVTPSYNQGRYIEETIQSVLTQDYPNLDYIVVDGGSTDGTVEILKKYEGRLTWISERDRGQADAINKGFRMAKGEIVAWLNSDDTYLPGAICKVVRYFDAHPEIGMLYGEGYHIDEDGDIIERYYTEPFDYQRLSEICFICQPTVFIRAEIVRAVGPLDVRLHYCLDYDYWMRIAKRFRIGHFKEYLANSRLHTDTKTLSKRLEVHRENLQVVKKHYGQVPMRWINAYVHVLLTEWLMPKIQGIYEDGWASPRVKFSLPHDGNHYAYLILQGRCSLYARPLPLSVIRGHHVLQKAVIDTEEFSLITCLRQEDGSTPSLEILEVKLSAEASFIPSLVGINEDARKLAYCVKKLSLVDRGGDKVSLYAGPKPWLFALALPVLSLGKSLVVNHRVAYTELWQTTRNLWRDLVKLSLKSLRRHS